MRRVRSQLDNLAAQPAGPHHAPMNVQAPIGGNNQSYEIQRQLQSMGIHPFSATAAAYGAPAAYQQPVYAQMPQQPAPAAISNYAQPAGTVELDNIKASLDRLTGKLQGIAQAQSSKSQPTATDYSSQFERINQEFAALREVIVNISNHSTGEFNLDALHQIINANYNGLCEQVEQIANANTDPTVFAQAIEISHQKLAEKLTELHQNLDSISSAMQANQLQTDFSALEPKFEEISRAIMALSATGGSTEGLERIEARVSSLANSLDGFLANSTTSTSEQETVRLAGIIEELQNSIEGLNSRVAGINSDSANVFDGLATQLNQLCEKIDNIGAAASSHGNASGDNSALISRLDQLVERVETLSSDPVDSTVLLPIESQLEQLTGELAGLKAGMNTTESQGGSDAFANAVLEQLNAISTRVEQIDSPDNAPVNDAALASLEQQLANIAGQLNSIDTSGNSFGPIEERLESIEQQLGASRDVAIELATQAAEDAVNRTVSALPQGDVSSTGGISADTLNALADNIKELGEFSRDATASNVQTFEAVQNSLEMMVDRLGHIEAKMSQEPALVTQAFNTDQATDAEHTQQWNDPSPATNNNSGMDEQIRQDDDVSIQAPSIDPHDDLAKLPEVEAPELELQELPAASPEVTKADVHPENDALIEPGSGAPDLAALVRRVNQKNKGGESGDEITSGTDFIATARRAAQAAAAQAQAAQGEIEKDKKNGRDSFLPEFLRKRKKVLVMAAAAVLLIAVAMPMAGRYLSGGMANQSSSPSITSQTDEAIVVEDNKAEVEEEQIEAEEVLEQSKLVTPAPVELPEQQEEALQTSAEPEIAETPTLTTSLETLLNDDFELNSDELKRSAQMGDSAALFEIGRRFTDGDGVERDLAKAAKWYEQAAAKGFAPAQYRIGNFFEKGHGVEADAAQAANWYLKAAEAGNVIAMHNLAVLHAEGKIGGEPDMATAFNWFRKAAEYGVRDSQVNAGILYTNGVDEEGQNLVEAYKWFAVAAKAGDSDASGKRDVIANAMRPDQLEQARAESELWKPKKPDPEANSVSIPDSWKTGTTSTAGTSEQELISNAQTLLARLGFDPGPADGLMGAKTRNAIMAFQQRSGLKVDGKVSRELMHALKAVSI